MTKDRQNAIWAMLTQDERNDFQSMYELRNSKFDMGYNAALDEIFGTHNLTAQAEEKPKEPKFKEGDRVSYFGQVATIFKAHCNGYDVIFGNGATLYNLPETTFDPYTESNGESNHIPDTTKKVDYTQYRLDLAKEIAVAMINEDWASISVTATAIDAVDMANEIVKRLKETEDAD